MQINYCIHMCMHEKKKNKNNLRKKFIIQKSWLILNYRHELLFEWTHSCIFYLCINFFFITYTNQNYYVFHFYNIYLNFTIKIVFKQLTITQFKTKNCYGETIDNNNNCKNNFFRTVKRWNFKKKSKQYF